MSFRVIAKNNGIEFLIHDPQTDVQIYNDEWTEEMGKTPSFRFSVSPRHPFLRELKTLTTQILIYDGNDIVFEGRIVTPQSDIYNGKTIECVGGMSYLADSMIAPRVYQMGVREFMSAVIAKHNECVEQDKKFTLGQISPEFETVEEESPEEDPGEILPGEAEEGDIEPGEAEEGDPIVTTAINTQVDTYMDALSLLNTLLDGLGGYLRARYVNGGRYLDFLTTYGADNTQVVRFGENLLDISKQIDGGSLVTVLIPEGATMTEENADGTTTTYKVNISSVNDGKNYLVNDEAVEKYGKIWGHIELTDVESPAILKSIGEEYLRQQSALPETITVTALDLSVINSNIDAFEVGRMTEFVSDLHGVHGKYLLTTKTRHLTAPQNDTIVFGGTEKTISSATASNAHAITTQISMAKTQIAKETDAKLENQTKLITGGLGGYVVIGQSQQDGHPNEILIMDHPDKTQAVNVIRFNVNGIGFSRTGINGPYTNAWTIDGRLSADFIQGGTLTGTNVSGIHGSFEELDAVNGKVKLEEVSATEGIYGSMKVFDEAGGATHIFGQNIETEIIDCGYLRQMSGSDTAIISGGDFYPTTYESGHYQNGLGYWVDYLYDMIAN